MQSDAKAIISLALGAANTSAWDRLAYFTDTFGPRMSGSQALNDFLSWVNTTASTVDGLKVTMEPVMVPRWVRGQEYARMLTPRVKDLHFVGLGYSNGTGGAPVTAEVMVVGSHAELQNRSAEAAGKIVLFDWLQWEGYGTTVEFRYSAATWAAEVGAVAALIKSIAPWGIQTPHTGVSQPGGIAAGALSMEDSMQVRRMVERGQTVTVTMFMGAQLLEPVQSYNVIMDYTSPGAAHPDELVIVSGHADSWDIADGAMDDGGGMVTAWEAVRLIASLGLFSNRTIRAIGWVDEESGGAGAAQYAVDYAATFPKTSFVMESDTGAFGIYGLSVTDKTPNGATLAQLQALAPLLAPLATAVNVTLGGDDVDEDVLCAAGVPCAALWPYDPRANNAAQPTANNWCQPFANGPLIAPVMPFEVSDGYMHFHHTAADTADKMDPRQLQVVAATNAVWALSIANLPTLLPRAAHAS